MCCSSDSVTSSTQGQGVAETYITDDLWHKIFLHLPIDSIFEFRCVSKVWFSILSNPNFINQWYKLYTSLWTLLRVKTTKMYFKVTLSNPELSSQFINQEHDLLNTTSFRAGLNIVGSSNGLVLCTTDEDAQTTYYVCNPLTRRWVLLPRPPEERYPLITGFTCEETCSSSLISTTFKVIRVPIFEGTSTLKVDIFSSDLGKWNVYDVMCPPDAKRSFSSYGEYFVTHNGVSYWMHKLNDTILAFNVNKSNNHNHRTCRSECRLINLPAGRAIENEYKWFSHCLGESEGLICYASVKHEERSLSVWVLEEDWYLLHKDTKFYYILAQVESSLLTGVESAIDFLGFNPFGKNVVILGYKKYIWAYNIRTKGYEQLSQASFICRNLSASRAGLATFPLKLRPTILPPFVSK